MKAFIRIAPIARLAITAGCAATLLSAQQPAVTLLGYKTAVPAGWKSRAPASTMRLAEYELTASDGSVGAEVVVYFFGKGQGGTVDANLARWKAQFSTPDGSPVPESITRDTSGLFPTTFAEYHGTYARGIGAGSPADQAKPNQTLLAGIAESPQGTLFIQLFGGTPNVAAQRAVFMKFVRGLADGTAGAAQVAGAVSPAELAARLKRAVEQRDTAGVAALVYWGNASADMRSSFLAHMTMESGAIETAAPTPLGANETSEYVRDGVTYRVTLPPVGHISLKYPKKDGQTMAVEPVYGTKDGRFFLVTAEPVKKPGGA